MVVDRIREKLTNQLLRVVVYCGTLGETPSQGNMSKEDHATHLREMSTPDHFIKIYQSMLEVYVLGCNT